MRVRIFPKLLPPPLSWMFWWIVVIVALVVWGGAATHWLFHGAGHEVVDVFPYAKLAFIVLVAGLGGGIRLMRRAVRGRDADKPGAPSDDDPGANGMGGWPPPRPTFVNPSRGR